MSKKAPSTLINMLLSLTLIAFVASLALAFVNKVTKEPIAQKEKEKKEQAIKDVLPPFQQAPADTVMVATEKGDVPIVRYVATDQEGQFVGMAVESFDPNGFGGRLDAMVGFDKDGNITGYSILNSAETPGLGAKADKWFQKEGKGCVIGLNPEKNNLTVKKEGGEVDAITGSTITSRAFCGLIATAYKAFTAGNDACSGATATTEGSNPQDNNEEKGDIES